MAGEVFQVGASNPVWSTATYPGTTTVNQILYSSATNTITGLANGTTGQVLTATTGSAPGWAPPATSGTVTSVSGTTNQVAVANGTTTPVISLVGPYTPATYTAHGVLIGEGTSSIAALAAGTSGQILQSGGASADPAYSTSTYPATNAVSTLLYASSANVMAALPTANSAIVATNSSGVPSVTTASGNWLNTSRSCFMAYLNASIGNVTGDGTAYTVVWNTKSFDQATDFSTGTGLFTAAVTGRYFFYCTVWFNGLTVSSTDTRLTLLGSVYAFPGTYIKGGTTESGGFLGMTVSAMAPMTAGDTMGVQIISSGITKVVGLLGNGGTLTTTYSSFGGYLIC